MRGLVLIVPVFALALAGCGGSATPSSGAASSAPAKPKPTSDVKDCFDGTCVLKVKGPKTIPLNKKKFHYAKVEIVDVTPDHVSYQVPYGNGGGANSSLSPGDGNGRFGYRSRPSIAIGVVSIKQGTALVSLKAQRHM